MDKLAEGGFPGCAIEGAGGLVKLHSVKETLDVSCDGADGQDQDGVERVDMLARDQARRMADERGDRAFGKTEIVCETREAMPKDTGREAGQFGVGENPRPLIGKAA